MEVFSTLHSCLFNMSLVAQQIIVSQSEYLPSFQSTAPFSTSSTLAVSNERFNFNFSLLAVILEETITRVLSAVISSFSSNYKYLYYSFLLADL